MTATGAAGPAGATANAVTSLSLDPPLMLACLDRGSRTLDVVRAQRRFGISVLGADQEALARAFASKAPHTEKFREVATPSATACRSSTAIAWVACALRDIHAGGDHEIAVGDVLDLGVDAATRSSSSAAATAARLSALVARAPGGVALAPLDQFAPGEIAGSLLGAAGARLAAASACAGRAASASPFP